MGGAEAETGVEHRGRGGVTLKNVARPLCTKSKKKITIDISAGLPVGNALLRQIVVSYFCSTTRVGHVLG